MCNNKEIQSLLTSAGNNIFYCTKALDLPEVLIVNGMRHFRFCDFIYLPDYPENLSPDQVVTANTIRSHFYGILPQFNINSLIRRNFELFLSVWNPKRVLEIGPNTNPLLNSVCEGIKNIYMADLDRDALENIKSLGLSCQYFGMDSKLNLEDRSIDFIFAIFVFHFNFSENQIFECNRVLSENGVFIANIYKRQSESKNKLLEIVKRCGFSITTIVDELNLCKGHEYWFLYKNYDENKISKAREIIINQVNNQ